MRWYLMHEGCPERATNRGKRLALLKEGLNNKQRPPGCIMLGRDGEHKRSEEGECRIAPSVPASSRRVQVGCQTERDVCTPTNFTNVVYATMQHSPLSTCFAYMHGRDAAHTLGVLQLDKLCMHALLTRFPCRTAVLLYSQSRLGFKSAYRA